MHPCRVWGNWWTALGLLESWHSEFLLVVPNLNLVREKRSSSILSLNHVLVSFTSRNHNHCKCVRYISSICLSMIPLRNIYSIRWPLLSKAMNILTKGQLLSSGSRKTIFRVTRQSKPGWSWSILKNRVRLSTRHIRKRGLYNGSRWGLRPKATTSTSLHPDLEWTMPLEGPNVWENAS